MNPPRAVFFLVLAIPIAVFGQKTDLVILTNGDKLTGEVKKLDLDILALKTNAMNTIQIEWQYVSNIYAPGKSFMVEMRDKTMLFGSLDSINTPGVLRITGMYGSLNIPVGQVISIVQIKRLFINRFSGSLGAGISYTKASEVTQLNYNANITYTDQLRFVVLDVNSIRTNQKDLASTSKQDLFLSYNRKTVSRQFATVFGALQENTELGVALREMAGLGYGVDLIHTRMSRLRILGSTNFMQETSYEDHATYRNGEAMLSVDGRIFKYSQPELYLTTRVSWYPSFTVAGRNRMEAEIKLSYEVVNNFFIEVNFYDNFDNKPISTTASTNDYGIISSLKYTFGL